MKLNDIKMGDRVRDRLSGFTGIVTAKHEFMTGCAKVSITPEAVHDGKPIDSHWFDVQFIEILERDALVVDNGTTPGGPDRMPRSSSR